MSSFLETPAMDVAPPTLIGRRLGPYEVIDRLGTGGMGEVYRARDSRLGREVAIKTLPHDRLADESRRRRFVKEARAASALNHTNIVTIHEIESFDGLDVIVMELVSGKTLNELIRRRMKLPEVFRLAIPIADALARAHAAGIVHRDLKPANVMVTPDGVVKILDFGLAKLVDLETPLTPEGGDTLTALSGARSLSVAGAVMGTPAYMSPEQAAGGEVDARSDIFSFGAVLYEMVTGRRAFAGDSVTETLGAVMHLEATPPSETAPGVPKELERLILRCLKKDPARRIQHMADVKVELVDLEEESKTQPIVAANPRSSRRRKIWLAGGIAALVGLAAVSAGVFMRSDPPAPISLVSVTTSAENEAMPSLSPDGNSVAFSWEGEPSADIERKDRDIWIALVGSSENRRVTSGPDDDWSPNWSPDGQQIAFLRFASGSVVGPASIWVVSPLGGAARKLGALVPVFSQLAWSPDSRWIAAPGYRVGNDPTSKAGAIQLIPLDGAPPRAVTVPRAAGYDAYPAFSSDGSRLAYSSCEKEVTPPCDVFVADLDSDHRLQGSARHLTRMRHPIHGIAWAPDERSIVFASSFMSIYGTGMGARLWRVSIDGGAPERIEAAPWGSFGPSVNRARRRLIFGQDHTDIDIFRFGGASPSKPVVASSLVDYAPSLSPDGGRVAFESSRSGFAQEIWLANPDGTNAVQITRSTPDNPTPPGGNGNPNWSPDGSRIVFSAYSQNPQIDLFTVDPDGNGRRQLTNDPFTDAVPTWSHDGRWIYYRQDRPDGKDICRVASEGGPPQRLTKAGALYPIESWDGKRLLFTKTEGTSPLYTMPAAGGNEERVIDCVMSRALAVTRPNNLYYFGCTPGAAPVPLHKRDLTTGRDEVLGTVEKGSRNVFLGLAVSPDGKTVLYARFVGGGSDLMMLENFR
jgi:serine/threonine protein kinase